MIKILSDSTCDLSKELITEYDISILPLHIILGSSEYEDGFGITPEKIFEWSDMNRTTPKTSAPSMERAVEMMKPVIARGDELICFSISESMSSSANIMRLAAMELGAGEKVHVIDSANLSTGIGLLVVEAAELAGKGLAAGEIVRKMEQLRPKVRASFVVDTLTYLHRGGRCSSVAALAGSVLKLHPRIAVIDGKMEAGKKYRGHMERVIMEYVTDMKDDLMKARADRVFITHSGCGQAVVDQVYKYIETLNHFKKIYVTTAGGVISSHCGRGTLGVLFIEDDL